MQYNINLDKQHFSPSLNPKILSSNYNSHVSHTGNTDPVYICSSKIFQELVFKLQQIGSKIGDKDSIEQLMMYRFEHRAQDSLNLNQTLQDCLQFCVQQYHIKQQHLQIAYQIAIHFQHLIESFSETNYQQTQRIQMLQQQQASHSHELIHLQQCIEQLQKQLQMAKNKSQNLIAQYQSQKDDINVKNQVYQEVLRETYQSDRDELSEVVKELEWQIERRGRKIEEYHTQIDKLQSQAKNKQKNINELQLQNRELAQKIDILEKQIKSLTKVSQKTNSSHQKKQSIEGYKFEDKNAFKTDTNPSSSNKLSEYIENISLPIQIKNKEQESTPTKTKLRKVSSKSAGKDNDKNHSQVIINIKDNDHRLQQEKKSELCSKNKSKNKIKPFAFDPNVYQAHKSEHQFPEPLTHTLMPYSIVSKEMQNNQMLEKNNDILERCLYKVKSIQRFSEASQIGRFSNSLHFNLAEIQKQSEIKMQSKKQKNIKNISIGFNTEPYQQQQFCLDSPLFNRSHPLTSRSYQSQSHVYYDGRTENQKQSNKTVTQTLNTKIKEIFSNLVTKRIHKKRQSLTISQIQEKRKAEKEARENLSKSFYNTIQNIKQSLVGPDGHQIQYKKTVKDQKQSPFSSPILQKRTQQRKNLTTSMINFSYPSSQNFEAEPPRNMKKSKNTSTASPVQARRYFESKKNKQQKQAQKTTIFSSIFDFAVRKRIKKN